MLRALLVVAAMACGVAAADAQTAISSRPVIEKAVDGFIRPAYAALHASTGTLSEAMRQLCAAPSDATLDGARRAFAGTAEAWARAEIIRFGPVTEDNRLDRMLFWPDRKGTGLKQVQAALADQDASATDPATLRDKSIAVQGLGALDYLLAGTGAGTLASPDGDYRCRFGMAVAGNLDGMAAAIDAAWSDPAGIVRAWEEPGADNAFYHDDAEALGELLDVFVNGLELVRDVRINGFLGKEAAQDRPKQALYWRSGQTLAVLTANMDGLKELFAVSGLAEALTPETRWLAQSAAAQFSNAVSVAGGIEGPVTDVLAEPKRRDRIDYLRHITSSLSDLFGKRLAPAFGVTSGFSSLDGD